MSVYIYTYTYEEKQAVGTMQGPEVMKVFQTCKVYIRMWAGGLWTRATGTFLRFMCWFRSGISKVFPRPL